MRPALARLESRLAPARGAVVLVAIRRPALKADEEGGDARPRVIPVRPELAKVLNKWRTTGFEIVHGRRPYDDDFIVPIRGGPATNHTRSSAYKLWRKACEEAGVTNHSLHSTRHTFTTFARRGTPRTDAVEAIEAITTTSAGRWSIITTTGFGPRSARPWRRSATGPILTRDIPWRRQPAAALQAGRRRDYIRRLPRNRRRTCPFRRSSMDPNLPLVKSFVRIAESAESGSVGYEPRGFVSRRSRVRLSTSQVAA